MQRFASRLSILFYPKGAARDLPKLCRYTFRLVLDPKETGRVIYAIAVHAECLGRDSPDLGTNPLDLRLSDRTAEEEMAVVAATSRLYAPGLAIMPYVVKVRLDDF